MREYHRLTLEQRIIIFGLLAKGKRRIEIAREIGCHRSTISRELKRNSNRKGNYNALGAQGYARARRPHLVLDYKRKIEGLLEEHVRQMLEQKMSPVQISERLKLEKAKWSVSHETIYKWIYKLSPEYKSCLRWKSRCRQKRGGRPRRGLHLLPRKLIDERSKQANCRLEPGHWERDLLEGRRGGPALLVIVDRSTRFTIMRKVQSKHCREVNKITVAALKGQVVKSITNDNGVEFGNWAELEEKLTSPIYYCHPYCSSERGSVENTNGLIRQFFPKHCDFKQIGDDEISKIQDNINHRPRKTLDYRSALEVHEKVITKLVYSDSYYYKYARIREELSFKEAMIRETGIFIPRKKPEMLVALEN